MSAIRKTLSALDEAIAAASAMQKRAELFRLDDEMIPGRDDPEFDSTPTCAVPSWPVNQENEE